MATTYDRLKKIVVEQLGADEADVRPDASFVEDLNADSLDLVELIMSLEEEFGTEISDEDAEKIRTVQDAVWIGSLTLLVALGSFLLLFPVYFMIVTSLKTQGGAFLLPMKWLPGIQYVPQWENFPEALRFMKWQTAYTNTMIVAILSMAGDVVSAVLVAYGFARFRSPGKDLLFGLVLSTLMVPQIVRLVPEYLGFSRLGMSNTFWPLILPAWFGMLAPKGTPDAVVRKVNGDVREIVREPSFGARFAEEGIHVIGSTPEEFAAYIKSEHAKWGKVVKASGTPIE